MHNLHVPLPQIRVCVRANKTVLFVDTQHAQVCGKEDEGLGDSEKNGGKEGGRLTWMLTWLEKRSGCDCSYCGGPRFSRWLSRRLGGTYGRSAVRRSQGSRTVAQVGRTVGLEGRTRACFSDIIKKKCESGREPGKETVPTCRRRIDQKLQLVLANKHRSRAAQNRDGTRETNSTDRQYRVGTGDRQTGTGTGTGTGNRESGQETGTGNMDAKQDEAGTDEDRATTASSMGQGRE
jgi:hypothetical protein